jgi:hypothetical protein
MAARVANIAIDCEDVMKVANFWSQALDRPLDAGASAEFASMGGTDPERTEPAWYFNRVPEPKSAKNRLHVDVIDADPQFLDNLVQLGATVVGNHRMAGGHSWTVMQDPEGNEFCIAAKPFTGWT